MRTFGWILFGFLLSIGAQRFAGDEVDRQIAKISAATEAYQETE